MNGHQVRQPGGVVLAREMDWCSKFSAVSGRKRTYSWQVVPSVVGQLLSVATDRYGAINLILLSYGDRLQLAESGSS